MKKGDKVEGIVESVSFPNKGTVMVDGIKVTVKNTIEGQKIKAVVNKKRKGKVEARLQEVTEKSPEETDAPCKDFGTCGGCLYQSLPHALQLEMKERQVKELLSDYGIDNCYEGITPSPRVFGYRNKMEYSFGDPCMDGPLTLGLHKRGSIYDIVETDACQLVHEDFNRILSAVLRYFKERNTPFYHKRTHEGVLRHLVLRQGVKTHQLLINLVTSSQHELELGGLVTVLTELNLDNKIAGIVHTINDQIADAVKVDDMKLLYGEPHFYEEILGLLFKISPFSFFQTNTLGAERLYSIVRDYVGDIDDKVVYDLYSGTGTITQMLAAVAKKAVGVEIVEEAVEAAKVNAELNDLDNCEFIAGDVLKVLDDLTARPDAIILDPPREGIHPKALQKIIDYGVDMIVYVSCKPTSLANDLRAFIDAGYQVERWALMDMFPHTTHVETVVLITKVK